MGNPSARRSDLLLRLSWVIGPYLGLSALAGAINGIHYVHLNHYLDHGLNHLAAAHLFDQVSRDASFAFLFSVLLSVVVVLAGRWPRVKAILLPYVFLIEAFALYSRFVHHQAWSVTMPMFGISLPGFLWRRQAVIEIAGALAAAMILIALSQRFGWRTFRLPESWWNHGVRTPACALAISALLIAGAGAWLVSAPPATPASPAPIIWITWDSVRADRTSAYGYELPTTPHLEQFAADAVLFETAISQHNWTRPSYASMFTSRGVWEFPNSRLQLSHVTLAEVLRNNGYNTIGYVQNPNLDAELNMAQGFASYNQLPGSTDPHVMNMHAMQHFAGAIESGEPVFLFLHYQQPHYPYHFDNPYRGEFVEARREVMDEKETSTVMWGHGKGWNPTGPDAAEKLKYLKQSYDAAVRYADEGLGEALERLRALGIYDRCLVIVNSDHGDEFQEHGSFGHAHRNLHPELTYVPLVIRFPGVGNTGPKKVKAPVQNWDLLPTILTVAGIPIPDGISGKSLFPLPDPASPDRLAFSSVQDLVALRTAHRALHADFSRGSSLRFYDLDQDPAEHSPAFDREASTEFEKMKSVAAVWRERYESSAASEGDAPELSKELVERLRSLGYVQ